MFTDARRFRSSGRWQRLKSRIRLFLLSGTLLQKCLEKHVNVSLVKAGPPTDEYSLMLSAHVLEDLREIGVLSEKALLQESTQLHTKICYNTCGLPAYGECIANDKYICDAKCLHDDTNCLRNNENSATKVAKALADGTKELIYRTANVTDLAVILDNINNDPQCKKELQTNNYGLPGQFKSQSSSKQSHGTICENRLTEELVRGRQREILYRSQLNDLALRKQTCSPSPRTLHRRLVRTHDFVCHSALIQIQQRVEVWTSRFAVVEAIVMAVLLFLYALDWCELL